MAPGDHRVGGNALPQHPELVGQQNFLGHAHHEQAHPGVEEGGRLMAGDQLLIDIPIPDDGAGDELGKREI